MTIIKELPNGKLHAEFDSVRDVFRAIDEIGWKPARDMQSNAKGGGSRDGFNVFRNLEHAMDVFLNDPESIRTFSEKDDKLERPESPGKEVEWDVTGDFVDVGRFLTGDPEDFGHMEMGNPKNIFATINVNATYVSYTKASYLDYRQKRILRLVDWLEQQGVRCRINTTVDTACGFIQTTVKEFHDPFNLNDLAVTCHPEWLRRIGFLIMEQSKTWSWGYGNGEPYDSKMMKFTPQPEDGVYVYIGGYYPYKTVKELGQRFDSLEQEVGQLVEDQFPFNETPLTVGSGSRW